MFSSPKKTIQLVGTNSDNQLHTTQVNIRYRKTKSDSKRRKKTICGMAHYLSKPLAHVEVCVQDIFGLQEKLKFMIWLLFWKANIFQLKKYKKKTLY